MPHPHGGGGLIHLPQVLPIGGANVKPQSPPKEEALVLFFISFCERGRRDVATGSFVVESNRHSIALFKGVSGLGVLIVIG